MRLLKKGVQIGVSMQLSTDKKAGLSRESLRPDLTKCWPTQLGAPEQRLLIRRVPYWAKVAIP